MKKLISDKELIDYISARLSSKDTRILHERAKINGETDLLYHVQMASLACHKDLADELLGEDDFMSDSIFAEDYPLTIAAKQFPFDKKSKD